MQHYHLSPNESKMSTTDPLIYRKTSRMDSSTLMVGNSLLDELPTKILCKIMNELSYPDLLSLLRACSCQCITKIGLKVYHRNPETRVKIRRTPMGNTLVARWDGESQEESSVSSKTVVVYQRGARIDEILQDIPARLESISIVGMDFDIHDLRLVLERAKTVILDRPYLEDYEDIFYYICYLGNQGRFLHLENLTLTRTKGLCLRGFGISIACFVKNLSWPSYCNLEMCPTRKDLLQGLIEAAQICLPQNFRLKSMELPTMMKNAADREWETFVQFYFPNLDFIEISTPSRVFMYHTTKILKENGLLSTSNSEEQIREKELLLKDSNNNEQKQEGFKDRTVSYNLSVRTTKCHRIGFRHR